MLSPSQLKSLQDILFPNIYETKQLSLAKTKIHYVLETKDNCLVIKGDSWGEFAGKVPYIRSSLMEFLKKHEMGEKDFSIEYDDTCFDKSLEIKFTAEASKKLISILLFAPNDKAAVKATSNQSDAKSQQSQATATDLKTASHAVAATGANSQLANAITPLKTGDAKNATASDIKTGSAAPPTPNRNDTSDAEPQAQTFNINGTTITVGAGNKVVWHSTFPGGASNSNRASSTFGAQSAAKTQTVTHKDTIYELNLNATNDLSIRRVGETAFINGVPFDPNTHANLIVSSRPANGSSITRAVLTI